MSLQINKLGRNERCPCGSGKKHKQCCKEWFGDEKGRAIPPGLAVDMSFDRRLNFRDALIEHGFEAGLLDKPHLIFDLDVPALYQKLCDLGLEISVMAEAGIGGAILLWYERTGDLIPVHVWEHWIQTGQLVMRTPPDIDADTRMAEAFEEVIDTYGPRERTLNSQGEPVPYQGIITDGIVRMPDGTTEPYSPHQHRGLLVRHEERADSHWPDLLLHPALLIGADAAAAANTMFLTARAAHQKETHEEET